jgi:hypothetical protein
MDESGRVTEAATTQVALLDLGSRWTEVDRHRLGDHVWRVHFGAGSPRRTVIAKLLSPEVSAAIELLARRWLPAVGLAEVGAPLVRVVPATDGMMWHLYADVGDRHLGSPFDHDHVRAFTVAVARIHTSFSSHRLLPEIKGRTRDLRASAHGSTLQDVDRALRRPRPTSSDRAALLDRLSVRFGRFLDEAPHRVTELRDLGGEDTLLHGDLWPKNGLIARSPGGLRARLVDWDRAGVGSVVYDVSTLLARLPSDVRAPVLGWYSASAGPIARALSSRDDLNQLAETCERTRLAEWTYWRLAALDSPAAEWAWGELARVEPWLEIPVLFPRGGVAP